MQQLTLLNVAVLFLLLVPYQNVHCEEILITPSSDAPCLRSPSRCSTLQQYINSPSTASNVTLKFLSGNHALQSPLLVAHKESFVMMPSSNAEPHVLCTGTGSLRLSFLQHVGISGISFSNCGCNTARSIDHLTLQHASFENASTTCNEGVWSIITSSLVSIEETTFATNFGQGRGALTVDNVANVTITKSTFANNHARVASTVGGALYVIRSNPVISQCDFVNNQLHGSWIYGGAVHVSIANSSVVRESNFTGNRIIGNYGDGGALYMATVGSSMIDDCEFKWMVYLLMELPCL